MRGLMKTNLKLILLSLGAISVLASPVMAKPERHHHAAPIIITIPSAVRNLLERGLMEGGAHTPDWRSPWHGPNSDFQDGSRG